MTDTYRRVVGVDLSLSSAGVATYPDIGAKTVGEGGITKMSPLPRFRALQRLVRDIYRGATLDAQGEQEERSLVVIEGLEAGQGNARAGGQSERAFAWWWLVGLALDTGHDVVMVNPIHLKVYATGRGDADKAAMLAAARSLTVEFPLRGDHNRADAALLVAVGRRFVGRPIDAFSSPKQLDVITELTSARGLVATRPPQAEQPMKETS